MSHNEINTEILVEQERRMSLKISIDVMWSRTADELSRRTHGYWSWWKLEVNSVEEGCIDLTQQWQLTAAERRVVFEDGSRTMIFSQRLWLNLIVLTEKRSQLKWRVGSGKKAREAERGCKLVVYVLVIEVFLSLISNTGVHNLSKWWLHLPKDKESAAI